MRIPSLLVSLCLTASGLAGINSFTANPTVFLPGQEVTLSWNVSAGDQISIDQGVGPVAAPGGTVTVIPSGPTTYTLTDSTSGTTAQATVNLSAPPQLVHRWSFSETSGTAVIDSVGGADGTILGAGSSRPPGQVSLPGGGSGSAAYIDLPNGLISTLNEVTIEGWMTLNGSQNWSRYFDFGIGSAGEINAPGGSASGTEYLMISAQIGGTTTQRRLAMRDNNVEQMADLTDAVNYGQQFHFAVIYDADGNGGQPQVRYYKNGALVGALNTTYRLQGINDVNNWIGRSNWTADANTNAAYNEFRIWNGVLSESVLADEVATGPDALSDAPRIESFTAFPATSIFEGSSARLSYVLSGDGVAGSIDQGVGALTGASGFVTITPAQTTTYTLTATGTGGTRTATVTINVAPSAPTAENLALVTGYQTASPITLIGRDPNTPVEQLNFIIVTPPAHGALSGAGPNQTFTPTAGFSGPDSFSYRVNDGTSDSNVATVSIVVNPAPMPPADITLSGGALTTKTGVGSFAGRLRAIDPNPDDTFTFALVAGAGSTHNDLFSLSGSQIISQHDFSPDLSQAISIRVRVTDGAGNALEKVFTRTVAAADLRVRINEINYNPVRNTVQTEYIELYNPAASAVDVSGWHFTDGVTFTFPGGASIPAQGFLVIAADPPTIEALYGVTALGPWEGGLSSDGENIRLTDSAGATIDDVDYGITSPWPVPPNGGGPSLELINPELDSDLGGNWRASTAAPAVFDYIAAGAADWHYRKGTSEASDPREAWRAEGFVEDDSWLTGMAAIGLFKRNSNTPLAASGETGAILRTNLTDMATFTGAGFTSAYRSVFFRKSFDVTGAIPRTLLLRVMHNDAAIVWLNGVEVARFGFIPGSLENPAFDTTDYYELGNDPWSEVLLTNVPALLHAGTNVLSIQGFAKLPEPRSQQEDLNVYRVFDFSIDAELRNAGEAIGTPGAVNSVFAANAAPAVSSIGHAPSMPHSWEPIAVTARVRDPQGVGAVELSYQVCAPGNYIPATLPLSNAQILFNPAQELPPNPAFELAANWTSIPMVDDGSVAGDVPGDGIYTARIPAQANRSLVRYRISATDIPGVSQRYPSADDPRKNFTTFVYDGVPAYVAGGQVFSPDTLTTLPVYQWITRAADYSRLLAYNGAEQFANSIDLNVLLARRYYIVEGALVVGDQVIDHTGIRLRGGNSRYAGSGKRHFRYKFPKGLPLIARDEQGRKYPTPWEDMLFNKMFGNKGFYDWGLTYEVGARLWRLQGVPMPESHWVHFRVVQNAAESASPTTGDFWGLYQALEFPDGSQFLKARNLPPGNFYKMSDWTQNGEMSERYQAPKSVDFGEDFDNIRYNIHQTASDSTLNTFVNMPLWYRYNAVQEAIRHYDIFVEPTGRHRVKNLIWYFHPQAGTSGLGQLWFTPYDWDASFGPNFNNGWDFVHNALYDHFNIPDSPTWVLPKQPRTDLRIQHRNAIRELRDLLWYRESGSGRGPFDDIVDDAFATISAFWPVDRARWPVTGAVADNPGGAPFKVQDMKGFAFTGWTDGAGNDPAVGAGGRAAFLDAISDGLDGGQLPAKPTIAFNGTPGTPVDGIMFQSSDFSDPQGAGTFAAMQWRVGEITDPAAPAYDPAAPRIYEITPVWESGELTAFNASIAVPGTVLRAGHTYRARVRHRDDTGRWSHWSDPVQLTATPSDYVLVLQGSVVVSEVMYHPAPPNAAEAAAGYLEGDFEFIELLNVSPAMTVDLGSVRFTKGVDFDFANSMITSLAPGARALIVKNKAAFELRYGAGRPIAGEWDLNDNLSNSGENVKLSYGAGAAIREFIYDDDAPWPVQADAGGYSIVLKAPETLPDPAIATNWRASGFAGGSPGGDDRQSFGDWAAANTVTGLLGDDENDGLLNFTEYGLGGNPHLTDLSILPASAQQMISVNGAAQPYLTLTFRRLVGAEDILYAPEWTTDFNVWTANGVLVNSTFHGDGTATETWRAPAPTTATDRYFGRLRLTQP